MHCVPIVVVLVVTDDISKTFAHTLGNARVERGAVKRLLRHQERTVGCSPHLVLVIPPRRENLAVLAIPVLVNDHWSHHKSNSLGIQMCAVGITVAGNGLDVASGVGCLELHCELTVLFGQVSVLLGENDVVFVNKRRNAVLVKCRILVDGHNHSGIVHQLPGCCNVRIGSVKVVRQLGVWVERTQVLGHLHPVVLAKDFTNRLVKL